MLYLWLIDIKKSIPMETLLAIILVVLIIFFIVFLINHKKQNDRYHNLLQQIYRMKDEFNHKLEIVVRNQFEVEKIVKGKKIEPKTDEKLEKQEDSQEEKYKAAKEKPEKISESKEVEKEKAAPYYQYQKKQPKKEKSFWEKYPDLEKFIGENLINKIGIVILVFGLAFFVKYAIDKNWIGEIGRVAIGISSGGILIAIAHRLRKTFQAFSSVLVGGGLAVLYFSIALGFQDYELFSQGAAFVIMIIITSFAVLLSLFYNRKELAVLAIVGGFATPLMVTTGQGNYKVLFTYILILNLGMLVLSYFKKWNIVHIVSFFFTIILYGGWLTNEFVKDTTPYIGAFLFATLFYIVFFLMIIINNLKEEVKFTWLKFSMLLINTLLYYTAGMTILEYSHPDYQGLFTALVAIFNFIFALSLFHRRIDKNLLFLLIGLVLTFLSLIAPVQLEGNYITLFWAAEMVLLYWLSLQSGIKIIKFGAVIVLLSAVVSLSIDWYQLYLNEGKDLSIVLNKAFITSGFTMIALFVNHLLTQKEKEEKILNFIPVEFYKNFLAFLIMTGIYLSIAFETAYQTSRIFDFGYAVNACIVAFSYFYLCFLLIWSMKKDKKYFHEGLMMTGVLGILLYLTVFHFQYIEIRDAILTNEFSYDIAFYIHFAGNIFLLLSAFLILKGVQQSQGTTSTLSRIMLWLSILLVIFVLSSELDHIVMLTMYQPPAIEPATSVDAYYNFIDKKNNILDQSHKIGFPILWGLSSFLLMIIGMKKEMKQLRIISLVIFFITILKLFIFDVWKMKEAGRIAAFISLGILLLVVSFMYQKLKKIIFENNKD